MKLETERTLLSSPAPAGPTFGLADLVGVIWRHKWLVLLLALAGGALGYAVGARIPPRYTASAALISDTSQARILDLESQQGALLIDPSATTTVVETLRTTVIAEQALADLPPEIYEAIVVEGQIREQLAELAAAGSTADPAVTERALAVQHLLDNLTVSNSGRSYVINVAYGSTDPKVASTVANVLAQAYLQYRDKLRGGSYAILIDNLEKEVASQRLGVQSAELMAETAREERRVLTQRSTALSGPQLEDEIALGARLYARQREAEREADTLAAIYENTLRTQLRLKSVQAAPEINIQLFSQAIEPLKPDGIGMKPVLALFGAAFGFLLAAAIGILRTRPRT